MHKVIIADDNALSIKGLEANLNFASIGAELTGSFLSGMDVLHYLDSHDDVDLLVSDIRMPHMTGLDLAREALRRNKMMKIVLISAYDDFEYAQEALRIGVTDYVQKPIQYEELTATIQKALLKLEEERAILQKLEETQPELRKKFYLDLTRVRPALAPGTLSGEAAFLGIVTHGGSFLCVAVSGELSEESMTSPDLEKMILNQFIQTKALESWFGAKMDCHLISGRDDHLLILHDPAMDEKGMVQLVHVLCEEFGASHENFGSTLYFGIGTAYDTLWKIPSSMDAARRAVNRRFVYPDRHVFTPPVEDVGTLSFLTRINEVQAEIVQLLLRRNVPALDGMIALLIQNIVEKLKDQNLIVSYLLVLVSGVLGQVSQDGVDMSEAARTIAALGVQGRRPMGVREIEGLLRQFFRQAVAALDQSLKTYQQKLLSKVKTYIDAHLQDSQLRLENISDAVHVTPSHLSRIFKKTEGVNVSDYIAQKRIDKATRLLCSTSESISFISEQAGYASPYYFSACFKKVTGMSPSDYRKGAHPE